MNNIASWVELHAATVTTFQAPSRKRSSAGFCTSTAASPKGRAHRRLRLSSCRGRSRCFRVLFRLIIILTFAFDSTSRTVVAGGAPIDLIFFSDSGTCLRSTTKVSLLISLTGSPAKISRPSFALPGRTAEVTSLSTAPSTFFCSTTLGARPSPPTGPVDFWGVAAPRLSCWEYWDEKSQFGHTLKCDKSTTIIIEIIAKGMHEHWSIEVIFCN